MASIHWPKHSINSIIILFSVKMDAHPAERNPVHFYVHESDSDEVDMSGLLDDVNGSQEHTANDSDADSEFGSKSKEIEVIF